MKFFEILSNIIINAGIAHGFLIAFILGGFKNKRSHFLLYFLLMDLSIVIFRIHYLNYYLFDKLGYLLILADPFMFLLGPLFFFYLRGIVKGITKITWNDLKHFVLFVLYLILHLFIIIIGYESNFSIFIKKVIASPWIFLVIQFGYYLIQAYRLIHLHKKNIVEKFSNVQGMDVSWLKLIIWIFALILIFISIATPMLIHGINFMIYNTTSAIFFSLILFFIAYKGIQQRVPVEIIDPELEDEMSAPDIIVIQKLKKELLAHMEANKPFLNPELTLTELAKQVSIGRNQLSQVINTGVGDNFYNFINTYRIKEVKELIKKDRAKQYTILSLAYEAGFNSKSSFNNIFKKITGLTPSEYRNGQF